MQEMASERWQIAKHLRCLGCCEIACSAEEVSGLLQTMIVFAFDWKLGELQGGRRVSAGWRQCARLAPDSMLCVDGVSDATELPPSPLIVFAEVSISHYGARELRLATTITPYQALLFGGRGLPIWRQDGAARQVGAAILQGWLPIRAELESALLLGALRTVTKKVMQYAAWRSLDSGLGWPACHKGDIYLQEWRACVRAVACQPYSAQASSRD
jgi:hypothetical protein